MDLDNEYQVDNLIHKIKHYLITTMGVTIDEATQEEFYRAFSLTLREEIMINWTACAHTFKNKQCRTLYYLCMEYMPGKFVGNNITNIRAMPLVQTVLKKLGRDFASLLQNESDPGLGNGGLGRLAACFMDSLATQQYPAVGYGLRYQYGIFEQEIWAGNQVERPEAWLLNENPWEFRRDISAVSVYYGGHVIPSINNKGQEIYDLDDCDVVRALPFDIPIIGYKEGPDFNVNTLRLWSTKESPRNFELQRFNAGHLDQAAENTCLTDVLYPNDNNENGKRFRIKQEFLLASASLQDIINRHLDCYPDMRNFADKVRIQINDTHPVLVIPEMMFQLINNFDFAFGEAFEVVKTCCAFTNHTVLKEAMEEWNINRMEQLFPRQYKIIEKMNQEFCTSIRQKYPYDEERVQRMSFIEMGQVRMANLAIYGTHKVNGVAALHTEILKNDIFKDFYQMYPDRFINVTNGVTQRRWLLYANPALSEFISKRIGRGWITNFSEIQKIGEFGADVESQNEFLKIKKENKEKFIQFLKEKNPIRDGKGNPVQASPCLDSSALFDVQIKRFHEYKRQLMNALHTLMIYLELLDNPNARQIKRMVIFGGKAAPGYQTAKDIILFIYALARKINNDPKVNQKLEIAFIENYNVSKAEIVIPAADISIQISTAGMEASGTGNMKLAMNGALTIGTEDGANIEMRQHVTDRWWPFSFGAHVEDNVRMRREHSYNSQDIYIHDELIRKAVNCLNDGTIAQNDDEHQRFSSLYYNLMETSNGNSADRFFVLNDLRSYYDVQKKVEELYLQPSKWAEYALHNIAGMGTFTTDESINNYARLAWDLQRVPVDPFELARVRDEYSEHDKCRILRAQ